MGGGSTLLSKSDLQKAFARGRKILLATVSFPLLLVIGGTRFVAAPWGWIRQKETFFRPDTKWKGGNGKGGEEIAVN